ncbi:RCC1/BLIP-II protein [Lepidopterella palustris CBS 459.81]|uniref:RCC1/BLIP-II protein n=1 Tax=Lepidopterella palustris CBS 459.81 TaxID=1314670 RepID=A0A8E2JE99_9PEZI|nr:RCC1/BLIP-II protein [Lepidopterella palustris CBS 459.81]
MALYALGSNGSYQLGLGLNYDTKEPIICTPPENLPSGWPSNIVKIIGGGNHTLILIAIAPPFHIQTPRAVNALYAAGDNSDLRCGPIANHTSTNEVAVGDRRCLLRFEHIINEVRLCAACWKSSAILLSTVHGESFFTSGTGSRGELGQGPDCTTSQGWNAVLTDENWTIGNPNFDPVDLAGGVNHFVTVMSNGDVYGWGNGRHGQLGEPKEDSWTPRKIAGIPFKAVRAVCGENFTYIVGSPETGEHIILGTDKYGLKSQALISIPFWKDIGASWKGIYVLFDTGALIGWGDNKLLQLPPPSLPPIDQIAVGSEHVVAKTMTGKVLAWGWGEHGNCGDNVVNVDPGTNQHRLTGWNEIPVEGNVRLLGAGAATTWIYTEPWV